jgi:hypothetical protein
LVAAFRHGRFGFQRVQCQQQRQCQQQFGDEWEHSPAPVIPLHCQSLRTRPQSVRKRKEGATFGHVAVNMHPAGTADRCLHGAGFGIRLHFIAGA